MKKACIATYCDWSSYGSIMQSIGLKKSLGELGVESFIVKDHPAPLPQKEFSFTLSLHPKKFLIHCLSYPLRDSFRSKYKKCVDFIQNQVDVVYYDNYETLKNKPPVADYYLAGSDQIWRPALCKPLFFLDFVALEQKRLSYAASMGTTVVPEEKKQLFGKMIESFDSVSVREEETAQAVKSYTQREVNVHVDPTFLRPDAEWRQLQKEYPIEKPYILVYPLYWDAKLNRELKKLHRETGYHIVALCTGISRVWANKKIYDAGPEQFLWLIDHAEAVVTSSFHGVAFSLIFNKKLSAVINPAAPSRINHVLHCLGAKSESIANVMSFDLATYNHVNQRIYEEKKKSFQYLKEIFS